MTNEEVLKKIEEAKASGVTWLDLNHNQLTELPPEIGQLTNLTWLNLGDNQLTALPPELFQLTNLTKLGLGLNQLTALPPELFQLTQLTILDLTDNQLTTLPPEICQLWNLTELWLNNNQLTTLPPEIGRLRNLTELNLWNNQLTALPPEICQLTNLTELYLSGNQLTALPPEIGQLTNLTSLHLNGNPLLSPPPEITKKGIEAIWKYFAALEKGKQPLNEVKIILVGDGAAGKTSLVKQLLGEAFDKHEDTTHGINIRNWQVRAGGKAVKVNLWDFGGQEVMHATHQFFLSKRSLYVLVLDGRKDEKVEYWMRHIESFGEDSPVLVVLNKMDANPGFDVNRLFLTEKYQGIRCFQETSCNTGEGIREFRKALLKELAQVKMLETSWPGTWFAVKRRLEQMKKPYISYETYESYCQEAGIAEPESQELLVDFLNDLGVAVHFKDFELNCFSVLDPRWVTNGVYTIINAKQVAASKGILHADSLKEILKKQPPTLADRLRGLFSRGEQEKYCYCRETHSFILELMKKFELCWDIGGGAVLIPQLLAVAEPKFSFDYAGSLRFSLQYEDFLPLSVLPRFMVKVHQQIKGELRWRTQGR